MPGSKPLNQNEVELVLQHLKSARNRCLFITGLRTGYRISELLSLTVQDVVQYGKIRDSVTVSRKNMKGKICSRTVVLHQGAKEALEEMGVLNMRLGEKVFPICRMQASRILKNAFEAAKIEGKVTTHSMRKSFAQRIYEKVGKDLRKTQAATGHKNLNSLAHYLQYDQHEVDQAILDC